jgi:hypothetical protein
MDDGHFFWFVIPANAGIQRLPRRQGSASYWIPAFAGMTSEEIKQTA